MILGSAVLDPRTNAQLIRRRQRVRVARHERALLQRDHAEEPRLVRLPRDDRLARAAALQCCCVGGEVQSTLVAVRVVAAHAVFGEQRFHVGPGQQRHRGVGRDCVLRRFFGRVLLRCSCGCRCRCRCRRWCNRRCRRLHPLRRCRRNRRARRHRHRRRHLRLTAASTRLDRQVLQQLPQLLQLLAFVAQRLRPRLARVRLLQQLLALFARRDGRAVLFHSLLFEFQRARFPRLLIEPAKLLQHRAQLLGRRRSRFRFWLLLLRRQCRAEQQRRNQHADRHGPSQLNVETRTPSSSEPTSRCPPKRRSRPSHPQPGTATGCVASRLP